MVIEKLVSAAFWNGAELTDNDIVALSTHIEYLQQTWSDEDIYNYLKCSEEVNPGLDEDLANARMTEILRKYIE